MAKRARLIGACIALALVAGGCGSSGKSPSGGGTTIKIGLLTDETGPGASGNKSSIQGVEAGIAQATKQGFHIKFVVGDDQTSPSAALSAASAKATAISAQVAGLKIGYVNSNFPFGSTNVEPIALAMKSAGVNAVYSSTDPNTSFALITALKQLGANLEVEDFPDGYGGDLSQAGPGAVQAAQGATFSISFEPVELHTAATEQFSSDLRSIGVQGEPTLAEYEGYASIAALVDALKLTVAKPTYAQLITALSAVKDFNADGLFGAHGFDLNDRAGTAAGPGGCGYYAKLVGTSFQLIPGANPLCGGLLPGRSVSPGG